MILRRWTLRCPKGHETGVWPGSPPRRAYPCGDCERPTKIVELPRLSAPNVIGDVPEHYNISLGEPVRGRRHMKQLMRENDCHEYEPLRDRDAMKHAAWQHTVNREKEMAEAGEGWGDRDDREAPTL